MPDQRVYVVMQRTDIPDALLQLTELKPNDSQRNYIYETPGQTQYVKNIPANDTVATTGLGPITTNVDYNGLGAYLIDRVEDQAGGTPALTAAITNTASAAIIALAQAGTACDAVAVAAELVAAGAAGGTTLTAGNSTGDIEDVLGILAGRVYLLPGGSQVEDGANAFDPTIRGSFTNNDAINQLYETGDFKISNGIGQIADFKAATFEYLGVLGSAITVYAQDGSLL